MIYIFIDLEDKIHLVGQLWSDFSTGKEISTFKYSNEWLGYPHTFAIEPALSLTPDPVATTHDSRMFSGIADSCQDAWCRKIIQHQSGNKKLYEINYLIGMHDFSRFGALRFTHAPNDVFIAVDGDLNVPPIYKLTTLLNADAEQLQLLINPAEELAVFRPKASIIDQHEHLYLAKFSQHNDNLSYMLWEAVALTLAGQAKIKVPKFFVRKIYDNNVLFVERFDRIGTKRIHYISGVGMLNSRDDVQHSYLDLVGAIKTHSVNAISDLQTLWRRIVFNILISNFDDHLRNYGFLYRKGWYLAPLFDATPVPMFATMRKLYTKIDMNNKDASLDLALSVAEQFALTDSKAKQIISEVAAATKQWRAIAQELNIPEDEIESMRQAFEHKELEQALAI